MMAPIDTANPEARVRVRPMAARSFMALYQRAQVKEIDGLASKPVVSRSKMQQWCCAERWCYDAILSVSIGGRSAVACSGHVNDQSVNRRFPGVPRYGVETTYTRRGVQAGQEVVGLSPKSEAQERT